MRGTSAFVSCKIRRRISLSPCHLKDPKNGIQLELNHCLMQYNEAIEGVILCFRNVKLESRNGMIADDAPYVHCKVTADALVFQPREGMYLRAKVNKIGSNHVGVLVSGVFNGSIAASELPDGFVHNYHQDSWLGKDNASIREHDTVLIRVLGVQVSGNIIAIEATMRIPNDNTSHKHKKRRKSSSESDTTQTKQHKKSKKEKKSVY